MKDFFAANLLKSFVFFNGVNLIKARDYYLKIIMMIELGTHTHGNPSHCAGSKSKSEDAPPTLCALGLPPFPQEWLRV